MRRHDGLPQQRAPVRYLLMPKGQRGRPRPLPGSGRSHVGTTWVRDDVPLSQARDFRRTLCGILVRRQTTADKRWDWIRYYWDEPIEWDRVTCAHCLAKKETPT